MINRFQALLTETLNSRLLRNFSWNFAGNLVSKGAVFVTSLLAANLLGAENFGRIGIIQQTTAMMITFSVMGLSQTAILFVGRNLNSSVTLKRAIVDRITVIGITTAVAICILYLAFTEYVASQVFEDASLTNLLRICSLVLIGSTLNQIQFGILSGLGKFNRIAFTNIVVGIVSVPLTFMLMRSMGIEGFIWALVVNCWLTFFINKVFISALLKKNGKKTVSNIPSYWEIIRYAGSNVIGAILFTFASWFGLGVLTREGGLVDVAAINASMQIFSILYLAPSILGQVLMSMVSQKNLDTRKLRQIVLLTFFVISVISLISSHFSITILSLYSSHLKEYSPVLNWILAVVVIASIINLLDHYANGLGLMRVRILSHIVFFLCYVGLVIYGVNEAKDLAIVMFCSYLIRVIFLYFLLHSKLRWV